MAKKLLDLDSARVVSRLPGGYAHIGVYDVRARKAYAARAEAMGSGGGITLEHAQLFRGAGRDGGSIVVKDRFMCFWFYPPGTREGLVLGYPIDWSEHNLLVRLDPRWSYMRQVLLPAHAAPAIDANIKQQADAAGHLMQLYRAHGLDVALSVHMIGPRATDSLFYCHRWEPRY